MNSFWVRTHFIRLCMKFAARLRPIIVELRAQRCCMFLPVGHSERKFQSHISGSAREHYLESRSSRTTPDDPPLVPSIAAEYGPIGSRLFRVN